MPSSPSDPREAALYQRTKDMDRLKRSVDRVYAEFRHLMKHPDFSLFDDKTPFCKKLKTVSESLQAKSQFFHEQQLFEKHKRRSQPPPPPPASPVVNEDCVKEEDCSEHEPDKKDDSSNVLDPSWFVAVPLSGPDDAQGVPTNSKTQMVGMRWRGIRKALDV